MNIFLYLSALGLLLLCVGIQILWKRHRLEAIQLTLGVLGGICVFFLIGWILGKTGPFSEAFGFALTPLSCLMVSLILFISAIVHFFSLRYLAGDRRFESFFLKLLLLTLSACGFVLSDHTVLFGAFWIGNQLLLAALMMHKADWIQAREGGYLYLRWAALGSLSLIGALGLLSWEANSFSLRTICEEIQMSYKTIALFLVLLTALIQSGIWPFHRWLISSLNAPTPVSAFMHAGLVNGGGLLLARLAPLVLSEPLFLQILVGFGFVSVTLGTLWKLLQSNIKKMLACSTLAQMGFMLVQCGLGLFPAAIAHICMHGLFKGFLFLNAGSALQSKTVLQNPQKGLPYLSSLLFSVTGALAFSKFCGISINAQDTQIIPLFFAALASFHINLTLFALTNRWAFCLAPLASISFGSFYGGLVRLFDSFLHPMEFLAPQPLTVFHGILMGLFVLMTLVINYLPPHWQKSLLWKQLYVKFLNASQSDRKTITALRNEYQV